MAAMAEETTIPGGRDECKIIAEIGINHNGSIELCKKLIMAAKVAGCQYAKIQKRNPDVCVPEAQKSKMRDTPWGRMTYIEYKYKMEFNEEQIKDLVEYSNSIGIIFFASVWDKDSVDIMAKYTKISKIPSALITDLELCAYAREKFEYMIISTGMSTETIIDECYAVCPANCVMHTNSTYPCPTTDLNMNYILHLKNKFPKSEIGYSGHEYGLVTTFGAVALGASWVERHITWDRSMWGSDQSSSVEIPGLIKLVKGCNDVVQSTMYQPGPRRLFPGELAKMGSLRGGDMEEASAAGASTSSTATAQELLMKQRAALAKRGECQIIAEIGINHNGDIDLCKKLIMASKVAGAQYAKIQKRNPDVCVPEAQKSKMRDTPWGRMTYIEYKYKLEFNEEQIKELVEYGNSIGIIFFASVWDKDSADLMAKYTKISKIPSALINDLELCAYAREKFDELIISTGMSTEAQVDACVAACNPDVVMHTNSTYPCPTTDLNMNYILQLGEKFPGKAIGYSGHEFGLVTTFGAVALGASWVERHITWDRSMWGSDQSSSVEIPGLIKLVKGCNDVVESTMHPPQERIVFEGERAKMESLRPSKK